MGLGCYYYSFGFVGVGTGWPLLRRAHQYFTGRCFDSGNHLAGKASKTLDVSPIPQQNEVRVLVLVTKRMVRNMPRKVRSDKRVGKVEEDLGLSTGAIRNKDGRDTRSDKKLGTIRKEQSK